DELYNEQEEYKEDNLKIDGENTGDNNIEQPIRGTVLRESNGDEYDPERYTKVESNFDIMMNEQGKGSFILAEDIDKIAIKEEYKILLLGNFGVGKTNIILKYTSNQFFNDTSSVIGENNSIFKKTTKIDEGVVVEFTIEDTMGIERTSILPKQLYKDNHGLLIVFDLTDKDSFNKVEDWIKTGKEIAPKDVVIFIVGNKSDIHYLRKVDKNEAMLLARKYSATYQEVSAKTGNNIELLFEDLANQIREKQKENKGKNKVERKKERQTIGLKKGKFSKIKRKCCK
ncbi:MAG: GTP-binding protein, partial [archaeon]|nr:GTP-binding protein [archaeon]